VSIKTLELGKAELQNHLLERAEQALRKSQCLKVAMAQDPEPVEAAVVITGLKRQVLLDFVAELDRCLRNIHALLEGK